MHAGTEVIAWSVNTRKQNTNLKIFCLQVLQRYDLLQVLQPSTGQDSCLVMSLEDSQFRVLCDPFFTCCNAMEFAETGNRKKKCPDLPVRLLLVFHALRLECEKSMELTASSNRSCLLPSSRESRDEAALSESVTTGSRRKKPYRVSNFIPT